jgi:hypothetical protein
MCGRSQYKMGSPDLHGFAAARTQNLPQSCTVFFVRQANTRTMCIRVANVDVLQRPVNHNCWHNIFFNLYASISCADTIWRRGPAWHYKNTLTPLEFASAKLRICANQQVNRFYIESRIFWKIVSIWRLILKMQKVLAYLNLDLIYHLIDNIKNFFRENVPLKYVGGPYSLDLNYCMV